MSCTDRKKGFTLAEVLISLTLIGMVAALTVPTLKKNTERKEFAAKISKTYNSLAQITKILSHDAAIRYWDSSYIDDKDKDCFAKRLNHISKEANADSGEVIFHMADGQIIKPFGFGTKQTNADFGAPAADKLYGYFLVDVNGDTPPNAYGMDLHALVLVDGKGLLPSGYNACTDKYGCTAAVIRQGKSN